MSVDLEKRVEKLEEWMEHLPRIINTSFDEAEAQRDLIKARIDRLQTDLKADIAEVRADMAGMRSDIAQLSAKFDAMPRVIAEMLAARE